MNARHDGLSAGPAARNADSVRRPVRSSHLVMLGHTELDGFVIELVWSALSNTVLADFSEVEPRRIGTVVIAGRPEPVFVAQPDNLDWLGYENREARLLSVAVRMFDERRLLILQSYI